MVENVEQLGLLVKTVAQEQTSKGLESAPILVHCSGGVGRSGTFATLYSLYHLLQQAEHKGWKEVEYEVVRDAYDNCITVSLAKSSK